jgi:hypothetical protein
MGSLAQPADGAGPSGKMTASPGADAGVLLADLGLRLSVRCDDPALLQILRQELGALLVPRSGRACHVEVNLRPLDEQASDGGGVLVADDHGWDMETWGVRMRLDLGEGGGPSTIRAEVSTADALSLHLALQNALYLLSPHHGGILLHAAGVEISGEAVVISGEKDAGKSTTCRNAPAGVRVMGDEGILVTRSGADGQGGWSAHATPFHSDDYTFTPAPGARPIRAMVHLVRGTPGLRRLEPGRSLWPLMRASGRLGGPTSAALLELMSALVEELPVYELSSDRPEQVWPLLGEIR